MYFLCIRRQIKTCLSVCLRFLQRGIGGGEGRRGGKKNWLGRQRLTTNIWSGPVSKVGWHQGCDSSWFSLLPTLHEFTQKRYEQFQSLLQLLAGPWRLWMAVYEGQHLGVKYWWFQNYNQPWCYPQVYDIAVIQTFLLCTYLILSATLPPHNFGTKITWPFGELWMYYGVCSWTRSVTEPTLRILFGKENSFNKIILKTKQSEHENVFQD